MAVDTRERKPGGAIEKSASLISLAIGTGAVLYLLQGIITSALSISPAETGAFSLLHSWRIPFFYDLHWNLTVTACDIPFQELATKGIKCDGFPWVGYPPLSLVIGKWLGLGPKDRSWIGLVTSLALVATIIHQIWLTTHTTRAWSLITALLLLSFPVQLLIERNNFDAVLYVLMAFFCLVIWLPAAAGPLASLVLGAILTAAKIYPFFGVSAWAIATFSDRGIRRAQPRLGLLLLLSQVAVLIGVLATLQSKMLVKAGQLGSHGLLALGYINNPLIDRFGLDTARILIKLLFACKLAALGVGAGLALLLVSPGVVPLLTAHQLSPLARRYTKATLIVMTATGIGCYLTTINFDYRLVFMLPLLSLVISALTGSREKGLASIQKLILAMFVIAMLFVLYLPLFFGSTETALAFNLELVDEMIAAPFAFAFSTVLLLQLLLAPERPQAIDAEARVPIPS